MAGVPFNALPAQSSTLATDSIIICRDGIILKQITVAEFSSFIWDSLVGSVDVLVFSASQDWDVAQSYMFELTLTGNTELQLPTNLRAGTWIMYVKQDATGNRTMDFQTGFRGPRGLLPVLSTLPGAVDILSFISDGTNIDVSIQANMATP